MWGWGGGGGGATRTNKSSQDPVFHRPRHVTEPTAAENRMFSELNRNSINARNDLLDWVGSKSSWFFSQLQNNRKKKQIYDCYQITAQNAVSRQISWILRAERGWFVHVILCCVWDKVVVDRFYIVLSTLEQTHCTHMRF